MDLLREALDHPQKLYPIIFILFILLIVLYLKKLGEHKHDITVRSEYLGTGAHSRSMDETIEDLARRTIETYPMLDDSEHARMVRDELRLRGLTNVDMYEGVIFNTVVRLKGGHINPQV